MTEEEFVIAIEKHFSYPRWADKKLDGEFELYAQLQTRDGRKMGNAIIVAVRQEDELQDYLKDLAPLHVIVTDWGNVLSLTTGELNSLFYPPVWRMKELRAKRRMEYIQEYSD